MAKKRRNTASAVEINPIDSFATIVAEIDEAVELMRPHFPGDSEDTLRSRAESLRAERYRAGHWPDFGEVAKAEADATASTEAIAELAVWAVTKPEPE